MIDTAANIEPPWPKGDWQALGERAVAEGMARTPYGAFATIPACVEIAVRLTSDDEVRALNRDYRHKDAATNVLSFPMVQPDLLDGLANADANNGGAAGEILLGDIVLAYETCAAEAAERGVTLKAHAAHLIVHGVLHLLGHDHMDEGEAQAMESIERDAMAALGLHDPYPVCP
ncbi:MAG: rRNA maturation RNase YbeY [Sphingomonadaceae bacterium]|nr:rRNA maturation RNase YbeY [Sphingomonadaceae bacterium]